MLLVQNQTILTRGDHNIDLAIVFNPDSHKGYTRITIDFALVLDPLGMLDIQQFTIMINDP